MNKLQQIREAANNICRDIVLEKLKSLEDEPINFGDLGCVEAAKCRTDDERIVYRILIEEAAPCECPKLCKEISRRLESVGYAGVEVYTEW